MVQRTCIQVCSFYLLNILLEPYLLPCFLSEASENFAQSLLVLRYDYGLRARLAVMVLLHMLIIFKDMLFHSA